MWVARDESQSLYFYSFDEPPFKKYDFQGLGYWTTPQLEDHHAALDSDLGVGLIEIDPTLFPEVQWQDELPRKVKLVLED